MKSGPTEYQGHSIKNQTYQLRQFNLFMDECRLWGPTDRSCPRHTFPYIALPYIFLHMPNHCYSNVCNDNRTIINFYTNKRFGMVCVGQRWLDGNTALGRMREAKSDVTCHSIVHWSVADCCSVVMALVTRCQTLLEDLRTTWSWCLYVFYEYFYHIPSYSLGSIFLSIYIWFYSYLIMQFIYFYCYDYVFSLHVYVWLPWLRFFRAFSSIMRQMPG
jgi:hypothetical protein